MSMMIHVKRCLPLLLFLAAGALFARGPFVKKRDEVREPVPVQEERTTKIDRRKKGPGLAAPGTLLLGDGAVEAGVLARFILSANSQISPGYAGSLALFYVEEAKIEGINHDVAFAQMCLETGFLSFGGLVTPQMNNFCGLGSIGEGIPGESFSEPRIGVRAHIQHLKAYATTDPLKGELVDPRYRWVRRGSAPTTGGLSGTWAADTQYAQKIETILARLYAFKEQPAIGQAADQQTLQPLPQSPQSLQSPQSPSPQSLFQAPQIQEALPPAKEAVETPAVNPR
jgi:hypothetical protein